MEEHPTLLIQEELQTRQEGRHIELWLSITHQHRRQVFLSKRWTCIITVLLTRKYVFHTVFAKLTGALYCVFVKRLAGDVAHFTLAP